MAILVIPDGKYSVSSVVHDPFIYGLPIKNGDFPWQTVSKNNQMVPCLKGYPFKPGLSQNRLLPVPMDNPCSEHVSKSHMTCWFMLVLYPHCISIISP